MAGHSHASASGGSASARGAPKAKPTAARRARGGDGGQREHVRVPRGGRDGEAVGGARRLVGAEEVDEARQLAAVRRHRREDVDVEAAAEARRRRRQRAAHPRLARARAARRAPRRLAGATPSTLDIAIDVDAAPVAGACLQARPKPARHALGDLVGETPPGQSPAGWPARA